MQQKSTEIALHPFWVMVQKEFIDQVRSWRFIILLVIIALTCIGSLYSALTGIREAIADDPAEYPFVFLKIFTATDGTLPSFMTFISFLGPLLGIGLGFDAINAERNKGTLSRIMAQPIYRDSILNAKFTASLLLISTLFLGLGMIVIGAGLLVVGIPPALDEMLRMLLFLAISIVYVAFWLNMSILFSVRFRQPATSALSSIAVWLFFTVFYSMMVNLLAKAITPAQDAAYQEWVRFQEWVLMLMRLSPSELYNEATTTLLVPTIRSLGPVTQEQYYGAIPNAPLSFGQSLLLVWPQLTGMIAATLVCFAIAYIGFMRQEIRAR